MYRWKHGRCHGRPTGARRLMRRAAALLLIIAIFMLARAVALPQIDPNIKLATDRTNTITPLAVPEQTLNIGLFDNKTGQFTWALTEVVSDKLSGPTPPGGHPSAVHTQPTGGAPTGGVVPPLGGRVDAHVARINSYNMRYVFDLRAIPPDFTLALQVTDPGGNRVNIPAVLDAGRQTATVSFHPQNTLDQAIVIGGSVRGSIGLGLIKPRLQNQIGSFVLPHMLLSIIYEPPGAGSYAYYKAKNTVGTVLSVGTSSTSGLVERVAPNDGTKALFGLAADAAGAAGASYVGAYLQVVKALVPQEDLISQKTNTTATLESTGSFFSVSDEYGTVAHKYPGEGDVFVVLTDVMFAYLVTNDRVYLAPIAYTRVRKWTAGDLRAHLPSDVAASYLALDPNFNKQLMAQVQTPPPALSLARAHNGPPRFKVWGHAACDPGGYQGVDFTTEDYQAGAISSTQTQTDDYRLSGLVASFYGTAGEQITSMSYMSSTQSVAIADQTCGMHLVSDRAAEGSFEVIIYYDTIFRTFLAVRGEQLDAPSQLTGTVTDDNGKPAAHRRVTLKIGDQRFVTTSDPNGEFRFPFRSMPRGSGSLTAGKSATSVNYSGTPLTGLRLKVAHPPHG